VFGLIICDSFIFAIVVKRKRMQVHCSSYQGVEKMNKNCKKFKMVKCFGVLDIVSIPNGRIPLCDG
jgi:hypothetical protein